jgi:methylmalonyl-CoA/ethylmalonyl-CoA epimerase
MIEREWKESLKLGKLRQIGCVVRDLQKAMKNYEQVIGIGPFTVLDFKPERSFVKGRGDKVHFRIGVASMTPEISIELLEVVEGEPYHKDFLEKHGEGIQHLGFFTDDYDGILARAGQLNISALMSAETDVPGMGHVRATYLDTTKEIGFLVEIIEVK